MSSAEDVEQGWGTIGVYDPAMAPRVAEMFNAFNELWPGGFGGRVPYDAQRVHDWLDETSAIADLIAFDAQGEPVGYCGLYPHWRDADAAYVSVLGVVPRVKGKKYGRRLLLRAIEIAYERGIRRLDLHTWSGNLNAVPLYKKVGLFWVPETSVYMQNYLPGLFQSSLARAWFDRHPDWYGCFLRDLSQAPDKHVVDGMEMYEYVFEEGGDRLVGQVDRYGWGLCGVRRSLEGQDLAILTRLRTHKVLIGIPNEMTIAVENGQGQDLSVALAVEPFKGLTWSEPFPVALTVPAGERAAVSRTFVVDRTAEVYRREASEVIRSRIILGDEVVDLVTGAKIQPAVELSCQDRYQVIPPGRSTHVYLDLTNHAPEALTGKVDLFVEGVAGSQRTIAFSLAAEQVSGVEIPVSIPDGTGPDVLAVHAVASLEVDGAHRAMPTYRLPVAVDVADLAAIVRGTDDRHLNLLTDQVDVSVDLEGGRLRFHRRSLPGATRRIETEIGPPFGLGPDRTLRYDYEVVPEGDATTLVLRAVSRQTPDLEIRRYVRVRPGVREVEQWTVLTALQPTGSVAASARVYLGGGGGLSINPFGSPGRVFVPAGGRVLACDPLLPVVAEHLIPQEPEAWPETWSAVQGMVDSSFSAWFWRPDRVSKVKVDEGMVTSLETESAILHPGETVELYHLWYGFSYTSLADVRNRWSQLVGNVVLPYSERQYGVEMVPPIDVRLVGPNTIGAGVTRRTVELRFATAYPFPGALHLDVPAGWHGAFVTPDGPVSTVSMPDPVPGQAVPVGIELTVPAHEESASATVWLQFVGEFEMRFPLGFLVTDAGVVTVVEGVLEGKPVMTVSNGALRFQVCAEVGGNLIRLEDDQGRAFFYDNYPQVRPRFFIDYHIGGVEPFIFRGDAETPFCEPEAVSVEIASEGAWRGARAAWTVQHQEKLRGQQYSLSYFVLPGCPVVRMRIEHHNPTPRNVRWVGALLLDLALQGDAEETTLHVPGGAQSWTRHRMPMPFVSHASLHDPWAWAGKGTQSLAMVVPDGYAGSVMVLDLQIIGALLIAELETAPHGAGAIEYALALNQPPENTAELIRALAKR